MRSRRSWRCLLAGVASALALAACTADAEAPSTTSATQQSSTTAPTDSSSPPTPELWSQPARPTEPMSEADQAAVDAIIESALAGNSDGTPAAWIGIWSPSKGVYVQAYGEAAPGQPAVIDDHNYIGSLTKTVTATAVLQQIAAGTISLTDTVEGLAPALAVDFPPIAGITIGQLLSMSSGLPDYANESKGVIPMVANDPDRTFTARELIAIGLAANAIAEPGTPGYSTTNYIILGEILTTVTGRTPEELVNAVFTQAGMAESALPEAGTPLPPPASRGVLGISGAQMVAAMSGPTLPADTDMATWAFGWGRAGGGAYSTVEDLGIWGSMGLGTALLPVDLGNARLANTVSTPDAGPYGYGIIAYGDGWFGHSGQVLGWEADVKANIETGAVTVVMVNSTAGLEEISTLVDIIASPLPLPTPAASG